MPTRKIGDPPPPPCRDPEHLPAAFRVYEPGVYEHECPSCGNRVVFTVPQVFSWVADRDLEAQGQTTLGII